MKSFYKLLIAFALVAGTVSAQDENDASVVADWNFGGFWFPSSAALPTGITNKQMKAFYLPTIDPAADDFDANWNTITYPEQAIANVVNNPTANTGSADFTGAFKICYDDNNMYVLLKYTDDDYTGGETYELMWAPYMKINASDYSGRPLAWYARYVQFGGYKATYNSATFVSAMMVTGGANYDASTDIAWGGTNDLVNANTTTIVKKSAAGASTLKLVITIPFTCLTGSARPTFDEEVWGSLNNGKGITFDIKVVDADASDVSGAAAGYWWNSTKNDGYAYTIYTGYLANKDYVESGVFTPSASKNSVFETVTSDVIVLKNKANVDIYSTTGKLVLSAKNTDKLTLNELIKGVYVVKSGSETIKIIK